MRDIPLSQKLIERTLIGANLHSSDYRRLAKISVPLKLTTVAIPLRLCESPILMA